MKKENNHSSGKAVKSVPEGFHTVTPYLTANGADKLIEFMQKAFDANVKFISKLDNGQVMHATISIGSSMIMVSDAMHQMPEQKGMLFLYVDDVDTMFKKAIQAKGTLVRELKDEFYGDRAGAIKDPFGNTWWIATHIKDISDAELKKLAKQEGEKQMNKAEPVEA